MRAQLLLISVCLAGALASCGDDDAGGGDAGKQTKISAAAYPAMEKFAASNIKLEDYGTVCDELAAVKEDRVAAASEPTCRKLVALSKKLTSATASFKGCTNADCVADKTEPALREYLTSFSAALRDHNRALADALEPGVCLTALQTPAADIAKLEDSVKRLSAAVKRFRAGDTGALDSVFGEEDFGVPDPTPCKP